MYTLRSFTFLRNCFNRWMKNFRSRWKIRRKGFRQGCHDWWKPAEHSISIRSFRNLRSLKF